LDSKWIARHGQDSHVALSINATRLKRAVENSRNYFELASMSRSQALAYVHF
jgi:hypothetical protein